MGLQKTKSQMMTLVKMLTLKCTNLLGKKQEFCKMGTWPNFSSPYIQTIDYCNVFAKIH